MVFRRWKVSLPLFLLAVGATIAVGVTAKPDYTMTSYVQFIPARVAPSEDALKASMRNPWNQLGVSTLGQSAIYLAQEQGFLEELKAAKLSDNFTLTMTYPNPIVTIEVVAATRDAARTTTGLVVDRLSDASVSLQKNSGVLAADMIVTQRLDQGQNLAPKTSKVKRAIAAVAAAGLLLTAGGTVGIDALLRRRSRRRTEEDEAAEAAAEQSIVSGRPLNDAAAPADPAEEISHTSVVPRPRPPSSPPSAPAGAPPSPGDRTAVILTSKAPSARAKAARRSAAGTYRSSNAQPDSNGHNETEEPVAAPARNGNGDAEPANASDVRTVLQPKRLGGENGNKPE